MSENSTLTPALPQPSSPARGGVRATSQIGGGRITPAELAGRMGGLPAAEVAAVRLLLELEGDGEPDSDALQERAEEIDRALEALQRQVSQARRIARACQGLGPIAARRAPDGI